MDLNKLSFGNPAVEQVEIINTPSFLDGLFDKLSNMPFPENDSELTKAELNNIVENLKVIQDPENEFYLDRYKAYDKSLLHSLTTMFKNRGVDIEELSQEIIKDVQTILYRLKYHYQRPRPYQLAFEKKLKLFPFKSNSAFSPSYPSGHTTEAYVILNVVANKYPEQYQYCQDIITDVANSRVYLGLHYPSDNEFAFTVGEAIIKNKEFTKKHKI